MNFVFVFIGGGLGSLARYGLSALSSKYFHTDFPYATLVSNFTACFILGFFIGLSEINIQLNDHRRLFVATGFCGGFSTFSTFTSESFALIKGHDYITAGANVLFSLICCFAAFIAGMALSRFISR